MVWHVKGAGPVVCDAASCIYIGQRMGMRLVRVHVFARLGDTLDTPQLRFIAMPLCARTNQQRFSRLPLYTSRWTTRVPNFSLLVRCFVVFFFFRYGLKIGKLLSLGFGNGDKYT